MREDQRKLVLNNRGNHVRPSAGARMIETKIGYRAIENRETWKRQRKDACWDEREKTKTNGLLNVAGEV